MKKQLKTRIVSLFFAVWLCFYAAIGAIAEENVMPIQSTQEECSDLGVVDGSLNFDCKSVVLMEEKTGAILYKQNADEALPPASVTKIMTLLLVMEAIEAGTVHPDTRISVSANAA